jgi:transcriptional regulator with XRE-family HTH domain
MERTDLGNVNKILMERIKSRRKSLKFSQEKLAKEAGSTQQEISYYENGDREPSIQSLARLAIGLKVSADWLLGLSDDPPPLN